jgi:uncharacterized protein YkwD
MARPFARCIPGALILALVAFGGVAAAPTARGAASDESSMSATILSLMNADRSHLGLRGLRVDTRIAGLATSRAQWMAANGDMNHDSYGGAVWDALASQGIPTYTSGEAIGATTAAIGTPAADYLYALWRGSPDHYELMMSDTFNYIGVGVAYRSASGEMYASIVFAEAPDISRPVASATGARASGSTVTFTWSGRDGYLQTHTAGLRDFDVEYRVDAGAWTLIRSHTTTTQLVLSGRPAGHIYAVRVRDRDRRNNLSAWSSVLSVRV